MKLEKIEFGGMRGRILTAQTLQIFDEFQNAFRVFGERAYDALDPASGVRMPSSPLLSSPLQASRYSMLDSRGAVWSMAKHTSVVLVGSQEFPADYKAFQAKVEDLERRLGAISCQAFDDANGPETAFKVIFVLGSLLERPIIAHDFESRYHKLVAMVDAEMDEAKRIYDEYYTQVRESGSQMHEKNMPPISGALKWSSELFDRISAPVSNMRHIEHECASPPYLLLTLRIFLPT